MLTVFKFSCKTFTSGLTGTIYYIRYGLTCRQFTLLIRYYRLKTYHVHMKWSHSKSSFSTCGFIFLIDMIGYCSRNYLTIIGNSKIVKSSEQLSWTENLEVKICYVPVASQWKNLALVFISFRKLKFKLQLR